MELFFGYILDILEKEDKIIFYDEKDEKIKLKKERKTKEHSEKKFKNKK